MTAGEDWGATRLDGVDWTEATRRLSTRRGVTVAIPVYGGGRVVDECVRSVLEHTRHARILVIDDGSPGVETAEVLATLETEPDVEVVRHESNWGYTRTANHALELAGRDDVVLLNSDTVVGPNWLVRLSVTAHAAHGVATASAVSDNAGAMSVPVAGVANAWPEHLTFAESARLVAVGTEFTHQVVATGHGFCMYIRREAVDALGGFDEEAFPRGYGEENDFSRRAAAAGYINVLAPHVLVKHVRSVSFGAEKEALVESGAKVLAQRHPTYRPLVREWMASPASRAIRERAAAILAQAQAQVSVPRRVLYVIHRAGGGTPQTNADLMRAVVGQENYLLEAVEGRGVVVSRVTRRSIEEVESWQPDVPFVVGDTWREDYAGFLLGLIMRLNIELVHVRHLINQPLTTLPTLLRHLGVPYILSTHDFYYVCPTVHLMDGEGQFCEGVCTPTTSRCPLPTRFLQSTPPNLKHEWVHEWRTRSREVFLAADAVVATTRSALEIQARAFPGAAHKFALVEHGRDIPRAARRPDGARKSGPLRILAAAQWSPHKGTAYLTSLAAAFGDEIEWHVLGRGGEILSDVAVVHGRYDREDFPAIAREIDPDMIAVLATWAETYSHTLTEAWALGVPVLANDIGAVADRIREHGGGIVLPRQFSAAAVSQLRAAIDSRLAEVPSLLPSGIRSVRTMAEDYRTRLYRRQGTGTRPSIGLLTWPGRASSYVRSLLVGSEADRLGLASVREVDVHDLVSGADRTDYGAILIQRDVLSPEQVAQVLELRARRGLRVVVELDDDLVSPGARSALIDGGYDAGRLDGLASLVAEADGVIASTGALGDVVAGRARPGAVMVFENALSARIWESAVPRRARSGAGRPVYVGTVTHQSDLDVIEALPAALTTELGREVEIDVVGVATGALPTGFRRIVAPSSDYSAFVRWLRSTSSTWDVGLAPLAQGSINDAKSDLKLLDYTALGLPAVASARPVYADWAGRAELVSDDLAQWSRAVASLMTDPARADERLRAAQEMLRGRWLDRPRVARWTALVLGM